MLSSSRRKTTPLSPADYLSWTPHSISQVVHSVAWSPQLGLFAAGTRMGVFTSPDGSNWTQRANTVTVSEWEIAWAPGSPGRFVGVAGFSNQSGNAIVSTDGINWTQHPLFDDEDSWEGICWVSELGLFVAVANLPTVCSIATSPDGITWTNREDISGNFQCVAWSAELELLVVLGLNSATVYTSPDGITWTERPGVLPAASSWESVIWVAALGAGGLFVAVASDDTARVATSPDGLVWTQRTAAEDNAWRFVSWSPELELLVAFAGGGTNRVMISSDGITWSPRMAAEANSWESAAWSPALGIFVAGATFSNPGTNRLMTSVPYLP